MMLDILSASVAVLCLFAIVSPCVHTGVFGTTGLGVIAVASIWSLDAYAFHNDVVATLMVGVLLTGTPHVITSMKRHRK